MAPSASSTTLDASEALYSILDDFSIPRPTSTSGPEVIFIGSTPPPEQTQSQKINLSLIGAIPSLANAVAAAQIFVARGGARQSVSVDLRRGHNYIDPDIGMTPSLNGQEITLDLVAGNPFSRNIFETRDKKWVVLSAVYVDLAYQWTAFLNCSMTESGVREATKTWDAADLEASAAKAGLPMAICQTEEGWKAHEQGSHMSKLPIVNVERVTNTSNVQHQHSANRVSSSETFYPSFLPSNPARPLSGLKVIALTHAIAGPGIGRTLAEHGASVLQVMFTHGFEHSFVYTYANLGTASTRLNLHKESDRSRLWMLVKDAHVWVDSYREGAISNFGFSDSEIRKVNPGLIIAHVRYYGTSGPWASKPGFDMQGSASSGIMYLMGEGIEDGRPRWPPGMVINDYTTAYFGALAVMSIILHRCTDSAQRWTDEGYTVSPSLCGTAMGILKVFKTRKSSLRNHSVPEAANALPPIPLSGKTPLGYLRTLSPLPQMSLTPLYYSDDLLTAMGSCRPVFPGYDDGYDVTLLTPWTREELIHHLGVSAIRRLEKLRILGMKERESRNEKYKLVKL